jgi:hypothetical protein
MPLASQRTGTGQQCRFQHYAAYHHLQLHFANCLNRQWPCFVIHTQPSKLSAFAILPGASGRLFLLEKRHDEYRRAAANAHRWANMHMRSDRIPAFHGTAVPLCAPDAMPATPASLHALCPWDISPVPWRFIAVVSEREYGGPPHWDRQLAHASVQIPKAVARFLFIQAIPKLSYW